MIDRVAEAIYREFEARPRYAQAQMNGILARELAVAAIDSVRGVLEWLLEDPPATLDEPDTDAEVIVKMRAIVRAALSTSKGGSE